MLPCIGRSRSGVVARFMPEGIPYSMQSCDSPLRFFAGVSIAFPKIGVRPESPGNAGRGIMHRQFPSWRCSAIRRPCSAVPRHFSGASLMGFDPSQSCSCPQAAGCFHRAGPTCRLLSVRPGLRFFRREINRLLPSNARVAPTVNEPLGRTVDPGRSPRLLGFTYGQSAPRAILRKPPKPILP